MKDNIKNNSATLDMLKALNPNIKKDFNEDNTKSYFCNVVKEETNKDGELEIILRLGSIPKRLDTKSKAAEEMIAYTKNTAALNDIFNKSQGCTTSDTYETLNPNNQKDFDGDNISGYSWNVALKGFMDKDDKLNVTSWDVCHSVKSVVENEPSPILNMNTEQTVKQLETLAEKVFSDICKKSQKKEETFIDYYRKLLSFKTIDIAVCGCNSAGAVITSAHVLTLSMSIEGFLLFSKLVSKSKFFKEAVYTSNGRLLYKFNIKVYNKHELNMDQTLSNYSDIFVKWYLSLCSEENSEVLNIDAISDLATRLFDDDWCQLDSIMYRK